jgi:hypothetical protein
MGLKIKQSVESDRRSTYGFQPTKLGIPYPPLGTLKELHSFNYVSLTPLKIPPPMPIEMPEAHLPRVLNYYADYGGCGFWRMIWPEYLLNFYQKMVCTGMTQMVLDVRFYQTLKAIRFQRQATEHQLLFIKELNKVKKDMGFRLLYEVDDVVFKEDIPEYNRCRDAFNDDKIVKNILEIIEMMDEMTVTCQFMKDYYIEKTGNKKITVIPNYAPKFWLDRFYNPEKLLENFDKNKKRPRILYSGSGTHIDVLNRTGMQDDFSHVITEIIKARKKFKFVWKGCYPLALRPFIDSGEMEYVDWSPLPEYPKGLIDTNCSATFAPLIDNIFNKSKSNIKMIESGALGMPGAYQNLCTYEAAEYKFSNGKDLIEKLEYLTSSEDIYMKESAKARKFAEGLWLEDHINEYEGLYFTAWGSKERNEKYPSLISLNKDQII